MMPCARYANAGTLSLCSCPSQLQLLYFRYEITLGSYVFEWWEKILIFLFFALVVLVVVLAVYRQAASVAAVAQWHWHRHASKW